MRAFPFLEKSQCIFMVVMNQTKYVMFSWVVVVLIFSIRLPSAMAGSKTYVDYGTFAQWQALVPELKIPFYCGLTETAHEMWDRGDMHMPMDGFVHGDFAGVGQDHWAIPLRDGKDDVACSHLLIVTYAGEQWQRLFFSPVKKLTASGTYGILVSREKRAVAAEVAPRGSE